MNAWKGFLIFLALCLMLACVACGSEEGNESDVESTDTEVSSVAESESEPTETESTESYETLPEGDPVKDPWVDEADLNK